MPVGRLCAIIAPYERSVDPAAGKPTRRAGWQAGGAGGAHGDGAAGRPGRASRDPIPEPAPPFEEQPSGKFTVRVPRSLHRKLSEEARREGVSLNQFVTVALAETVGVRQAQTGAQA